MCGLPAEPLSSRPFGLTRHDEGCTQSNKAIFHLKTGLWMKRRMLNMKTIKKFLAASARALQLSFALAAATVVSAPVTDARIVRLEILTVESPTFGGMSFENVGTYEKIFARAYGEVDPSDRRNALITDINLTPRNANGMVEYSTDVHI